MSTRLYNVMDKLVSRLENFDETIQTWIANHIADYVVERGTDGNWRYEKWNSGKYEIWYRGELSLAFNTLVATPIYSTAQQTIYYPETMAGVHYAEVNFQANTPHCLGAYISVTAIDRVQFFAKANTQSTFGGYVHIHVIGRWK